MLTDEEICCNQMAREMYRYMRRELYEDGTMIAEIWYEEASRSYHILNNRIPGNDAGLMITYCPFCGKKLPEMLDPGEWIEYEYGKEFSSDTELLPSEIRKEFSTDAWWKNRHLDDPKV